jgi:sec-independent protein translocase protein TatA
MNLGPTELVIILIIVLLLFGAAKLPRLARSMGEAQREFKHGLREPEAIEAPPATPPADENVTMTRAELDAMIAEREERARKEGTPPA